MIVLLHKNTGVEGEFFLFAATFILSNYLVRHIGVFQNYNFCTTYNFSDLDPVNLTLLVQLPRTILIKKLLILQNLFQDNLNFKISKPMKFLNKLLSYHQIPDIFHHLLVLMPQGHLFGYEDFKVPNFILFVYKSNIC